MSAAVLAVADEAGDGGDARGARGGEGAGSSPRAVTRGEETSPQMAKVDWLNLSFPAPSLSVGGLIAVLGRMLGRQVSAVEGGGLMGFEQASKLYAHHGATKSAIGFLAYGGESQNGRWLLSMTGTGCGFVRDWEGIVDLGESLGARITRLDLAVDFVEGQHTVDEAVGWYGFGGFDFEGRMRPSSRIDGDWLNGVGGRTLYVGKAKNGKMLRVYEKGKQLGDAQSEWVRFEVQLGSRDRVIPWDAITRPDAFFAGCYPALAEIVKAEAEYVPTMQAQARVTLGHLLHHLKRSYGKLVDVLRDVVGVANADLIEEVRVIGLPARVDPSSAAAGVEWADVLAQMKRRE